MRLQHIVLAYFLIGATAWAGGVVPFADAGIGSIFIDIDDNEAQPDQELAENISEAGGPIQEVSQGVSGGLVAVWNLFSGIVNFLFWPISSLISLSAPVEVVVILGGAPTVAFYGAIFRVFRRSA